VKYRKRRTSCLKRRERRISKNRISLERKRLFTEGKRIEHKRTHQRGRGKPEVRASEEGGGGNLSGGGGKREIVPLISAGRIPRKKKERRNIPSPRPMGRRKKNGGEGAVDLMRENSCPGHKNVAESRKGCG